MEGFQLFLNVLQDGPDEPNNGNDKGTKGQGAHMEGQCIAKASAQATYGYVFLVPGPVPLGKDSSQNHLPKGSH